MPMRTSPFTPDSTAILERHRFCFEDNDDEIRANPLSRAHRNRRKGNPDNIFGRTPAKLPIVSRRDHPFFPSCDRGDAAGRRQFLSRCWFLVESAKARKRMEDGLLFSIL